MKKIILMPGIVALVLVLVGADIRRIDWVRLRPPQTNQTRGSVWVSEITGEVVRTQLRIGSTGSDRTTTTFQVDRAPDSTTPR